MKFLSLPIILLAIFSGLSVNAQVVINEISYNPPEAGNDSLEYIEIYNVGVSIVNLDGWHFTKGVVDTFPNVVLGAGEYFVTAINENAMASVFGVTVHQWTSGALSNSGESIILLDAGGNLVDSVAFRDVDPWPTEPDGMGPSLELIDAESDNNDGANWQASGGSTGVIINGSEVLGTPGAENSGGGTGNPAVTIDLANFLFTPMNAVVQKLDLVRWVNSDGTLHNVNGSQATYPGNPESFLSGPPTADIWQYDYIPTLTGLYNYQCDVHALGGMVGTLGVYDPLAYTDFPLRILRLTDGMNGDHIYDGVPTTVTGVVHGVNFQPTGYSFYIIQPDNIGINVFAPAPGSYTVQEGDNVKVSGVIDQFNGLLEIIPDAIDVLSTGNALNTPLGVYAVTEAEEGSYVYTSNATVDSVVVTGTSGYNIYAKSAGLLTNILIRVDADANINVNPEDIEAGYQIDVTGIGTQFDPNFPYTQGYQILATELQIVTGLSTLSNDAIAMTPNPVSNELRFAGDAQIDQLDIYSLDGKNVLTEKFNSTQGSISVSALSEGIYVVKAITAEGIWTSKVMVER